jgi:O-6-methylguanine DNA methyltransferase
MLEFAHRVGRLGRIGVGRLSEPTALQTTLLDQTQQELDQYFAGSPNPFTIPLDMQGTPFQMSVWHALLEIPRGETRSYADIARAIGKPAAVRAVGLANSANHLAIIVPCHRVIGADGRLTGYGGGIDNKRWLLEHEGALGGTVADLFALRS